ncbi:UNVERIFIED_CONTAM: hypothetical protein Sradi_6889000 [Sesamum radiatum]|uniref:Reverse transcriptase n=1 Tax=Sesamum radiatum TaxID=300843 RepID=A0AAW2JI69_SESRA
MRQAPGPDGYSAGFYKAAWSVIGGEVTQAILDFFRNGRLLKQINATLISLIPKVNSPAVVAEFRPISCCNVLYKAITKILVQRMRSILGFQFAKFSHYNALFSHTLHHTHTLNPSDLAYPPAMAHPRMMEMLFRPPCRGGVTC